MKDVLDGKNPSACTTYPPGTTQFWTDLFSQKSPLINDPITYGDVDLLGLVSAKEVIWLKNLVDRPSVPSPDGLKTTVSLDIPNDRLHLAYTCVLASGGSPVVYGKLLGLC